LTLSGNIDLKINGVIDFYCRRTLNTTEKQSYIEAVKCLTTKPAISGFTAAINRFDDHQAVHSDQTPNIHWVVSTLTSTTYWISD
jgi:tyrosinase